MFSRAVGEPESVPNDATPEMLTAGPIGSVGSACRLLCVNWPRVSFTVRGESVTMLLTATVWSVLSRPAEALARAQRAGAARVVAVDVVEAVANAELIAVAELVIHLGQEVGVVHRVGIEAGRRSAIPG